MGRVVTAFSVTSTSQVKFIQNSPTEDSKPLSRAATDQHPCFVMRFDLCLRYMRNHLGRKRNSNRELDQIKSKTSVIIPLTEITIYNSGDGGYFWRGARRNTRRGSNTAPTCCMPVHSQFMVDLLIRDSPYTPSIYPSRSSKSCSATDCMM